MRKILFRGQTRRKGEKVYMSGAPVPSNWVYGGVAQSVPDRDFSIIYQIEPEIKKYPVYADTVSQYTGIDDKNGNKIFEGDIIKVNDPTGVLFRIVEFNDGSFDLVGVIRVPLSYVKSNYEIEVIGNIYDNPEILKGTE